jgi:hypothetical protein
MVQLRITGFAGERIVRLASWKADIDFALGALEGLDLSEGTDPTRLYAMWSAALVAYGRVFKTDRRARLDDSFLSGTEHDDTHRRFLELRDRHIAHQVSEAEQSRAIAFLTALELEPKSVEGVGPFLVKLVGPHEEQVDADMALVRFVRDHVQVELDAAIRKAMTALQSLPVEELYQCAARGDAFRLDY